MVITAFAASTTAANEQADEQQRRQEHRSYHDLEVFRAYHFCTINKDVTFVVSDAYTSFNRYESHVQLLVLERAPI